jgi:ATP/maltotriose-dependent transcriptional regulator MalT
VHDAVVPQLSVCPVLVGRDTELAALRTALVQAEQGRGGVVLLAGPAGIGKSRLLRELLAEARLHGDVAVSGRAVASGSATPFRPLAQALLQAMRGGSFAGTLTSTPGGRFCARSFPYLMWSSELPMRRWLAWICCVRKRC